MGYERETCWTDIQMVARQMMFTSESYTALPGGVRADEISGNGVSTVPKDVAKCGTEKRIFARQRL